MSLGCVYPYFERRRKYPSSPSLPLHGCVDPCSRSGFGYRTPVSVLALALSRERREKDGCMYRSMTRAGRPAPGRQGGRGTGYPRVQCHPSLLRTEHRCTDNSHYRVDGIASMLYRET